MILRIVVAQRSIFIAISFAVKPLPLSNNAMICCISACVKGFLP